MLMNIFEGCGGRIVRVELRSCRRMISIAFVLAPQWEVGQPLRPHKGGQQCCGQREDDSLPMASEQAWSVFPECRWCKRWAQMKLLEEEIDGNNSEEVRKVGGGCFRAVNLGIRRDRPVDTFHVHLNVSHTLRRN